MTIRRSRSSQSVEAAIELLERRSLLSAAFPTDLEQYVVELINHERANPAAEAASYGIDLNEGLPAGSISATPKQPLAINPTLMASARGHTQTMLQTQTFSHVEPNGTNPFNREVAAGYAFTGTSYGWGENIVYRSQLPDVPPPVPTSDRENQDLFVDSNVPDRGHRLNLMNPDFKEVGVGIQEGQFNSYNALMTTQDFAYSGGSSFLTGVAYGDSDHNNFYTPGEGMAGVNINAVHHGDDVSSYTTTWSSGGFTLRLVPGVYDVTASGGPLASPLVYKNVTIGSQNVELDFNPYAPPPSTPSVSPTPTPTPTPAPTPAPAPTPTPAPTPAPSDPPPSPPQVPPTVTPTPSPTPTPTSTPTTPGSPTGSQPSAPPPPVIMPTTPVDTPTPAPTGSIRGRSFDDRNANTRRDPGDAGLQGLTVFLDANGNGALDAGEPSTVTRADGSYEFTGVAAGVYHVAVNVPTGWRVSTRGRAGHGGSERAVVVRNGRLTRARPLGLTQKALIAGAVFNNAVGSSASSPNEPGPGGWKVYLDRNGDGVHEHNEPVVVTRANGSWSFSNLAPGTYSVRAVPRRHYTLTTPPATLTVGPLAAGDVFGDVLIGEQRVR